jgi:L-fuconolactonase
MIQTPIIDPHQHLWDLSVLRLPWLPADGPLAGNHVMSDYLREAEGLGIEKTIYMEVDVDPSNHVKEAEYVLDLCELDDNPMVGAVIGGRPGSDGFEAYARRFAENPFVKGVRQCLHVTTTPPGYCVDPSFVRDIRLLGELGLRFDLCLRPAELLDGAKLAEICPGTQFILDHCGNGDVQAQDRSQWKRDMAEIARRPNVVCKVSGIVATAKPNAWTPDDLAPIINHTVSVFGIDRVMFASDWPVCTLTSSLRQWAEALRTIVASWDETDRSMLFHDNAVNVYRLN